MKNLKRMWFAVAITAMLPLLAACGGGNGSGNSGGTGIIAPKTYSVRGTISGLEGYQIVLQNNGENPITMYANGGFAFTATLADGRAYNVTVSLKPLKQTCTVSNGSGTIRSANVTDVQVVCTNKTGGVTLSGRIDIPQGVAIDGSVNDPNESYENNGSLELAQILPNPVSVGGYVNQPGHGYTGRLNNRNNDTGRRGNPEDYFRVKLKKDDKIILAIGESDTARNDLDLWLISDDLSYVDISEGSGKYEVLSAPSDGEYFVVVEAYTGASNYILTIGADTTTADMAAADGKILSTQYEMVPDQIIARFKDNSVKSAEAANQTVAQYAASMGLTVVAGSPEREILFTVDDLKLLAGEKKADSPTSKLFEKTIAGNPEKARLLNTLIAIKELRKREDILSAEPNYIVHTSIVPNDEHYELQWHYPMIQLPEAWDVTTGSNNVVVAVVDSGVLTQHPDLRNRLTNTGYSFVSGEAGGVGSNPNDPGNGISGVASSFHGTHVAGTIAAETNNGSGVAGVTWNTKIMPVRVMKGNGSGTTYDVMQGISYAAGLENDSKTVPGSAADIINLSLGSSGRSCVYQDLIDRVRAKGIIVIAAAGNDNTSAPSYPASCNGVISVSAVNINGLRASYSNYGANNITVAAPGGDSYPDMVLSTGGNDSEGSVVYTYSFKSGTSMAAPHVAGVAALMKGIHSGLSPETLDALLATGEITDITGGGEAEYYGYGLINAFKAVAAARKLAGGGEIAGLNVNPKTVNFGAVLTETSVTVSKIGTGAISVAGASSSADDWLTVAQNSVDGNGFGSYIIRVNRSSPSLSQSGDYAASVTFTAASGTSVSVRVTAQVRGTAANVTSNAGYHYVLLISENEDDDAEQEDVTASNGHYSYSFTNVPPGNYLIVAGSNRNNSGYLGDGGEALGAYPTVEQMDVIDAAADRSDLNFTTNLILSISNNSFAVDGMTVTGKPPAAMPMPGFKRLK